MRCSNCYQNSEWFRPVQTDWGRLGCCDFQLPRNSNYMPKVIEVQERVNRVKEMMEIEEWLSQKFGDCAITRAAKEAHKV